jgi:hypothetical protein
MRFMKYVLCGSYNCSGNFNGTAIRSDGSEELLWRMRE